MRGAATRAPWDDACNRRTEVGEKECSGAGVALLLLADKFDDDQRKAVDWTFFLVRAVNTIPL